MGSTADKAKGRVKEATGDVTGNESLEREGKLDRASGSVKEKAEQAKDKVGDIADKAKSKLSDR